MEVHNLAPAVLRAAEQPHCYMSDSSRCMPSVLFNMPIAGCALYTAKNKQTNLSPTILTLHTLPEVPVNQVPHRQRS